MPQTKHPTKGHRLGREERAARAAARYVRGADLPPASTLAAGQLSALGAAGAPMPEEGPVVERFLQAMEAPLAPKVLRARTRLALGLLPPADDELAFGLRPGPVSMQTARTHRPIELTLVAEETLRLSTPDLLLCAWHVLRRAVACLVLARNEPAGLADTAFVQDADPQQTAALSRAVMLTQAGGCEVAVLPVAFDDDGLQLGGALQLVRGPDACEALTFTLALVEPDAPPVDEIDSVLFLQELFPVYAEAAFGLIGAIRA